jgi:hypothetical protein
MTLLFLVNTVTPFSDCTIEAQLMAKKFSPFNSNLKSGRCSRVPTLYVERIKMDPPSFGKFDVQNKYARTSLKFESSDLSALLSGHHNDR